MPATIVKKSIQTGRLLTSYLEAGTPGSPPAMLIHGNVSSNLFWEETMLGLSSSHWVIAPDLRGYGESEALDVDATRGVRDWADDLRSLVTSLQMKEPLHLVGWSLGGGIVMQYAIDYPDTVASLVLINPISPYGFGGTKDETGTPCHSSFAGSGGGTANPAFVRLLKEGDRTNEYQTSPRNVLNHFYFKPPFQVDAWREEQLVTSLLMTKVGDGLYPGTFATNADWPGVAPGESGFNNAISPKYFNVSGLAEIGNKPPILWIRGADDCIVSDQSFFDFGYLGQNGFVPGWPGKDVYPAQPMLKQTRHVLEKYRSNGGSYEEFVVEKAGHTPHIEKREEVLHKMRQFFSGLV